MLASPVNAAPAGQPPAGIATAQKRGLARTLEAAAFFALAALAAAGLFAAGKAWGERAARRAQGHSMLMGSHGGLHGADGGGVVELAVARSRSGEAETDVEHGNGAMSPAAAAPCSTAMTFPANDDKSIRQ